MTRERPGYCTAGHKVEGANARPDGGGDRCRICNNNAARKFQREKYARSGKLQTLDSTLDAIAQSLEDPGKYPALDKLANKFIDDLEQLLLTGKAPKKETFLTAPARQSLGKYSRTKK